MGSPQSSPLNTDTNAVRTSGYFGDRGDGSSRWYLWTRRADGGDPALGTTTATAVTDPSSAGSLIAVTKGILSRVNSLIPGYPQGATPRIAGSGVVANASAVATLAGAASVTTYLSGFKITAGGATAAGLVTVTVTGLLGGTRSFVFGVPAGVTLVAEPLLVDFAAALPASAANTAIVVTVPALGSGNTHAAVVAHGYTK
jgi:hypothetical protein